MHVLPATNEQEWESFLQSQPWSPFLQSWTMGEVYRSVGQEPVRIEIRSTKSEARNEEEIVGICQAIVVPAKRGRHLSVPYGPVFEWRMENGEWRMAMGLLVEELKRVAREKGCAFVRMSPFWEKRNVNSQFSILNSQFRLSPLHLLAEHIWYLDLRGKTEEDIRRGMRSTTRNLIGRAEREGVTVEASEDPMRDLPLFLTLHEETRKRHGFTPYTDAFFQAQVTEFSKKEQCALYLARYQGEVIATSIHMIYGGETSYHHGASSYTYGKIPASYLLQWRAIQDAMKRGDRVYNFWGIAPEGNSKHPFRGVTTFKTGFGGQLLELVHCMDLPLSKKYWVTFGIETVRKWRRGF